MLTFWLMSAAAHAVSKGNKIERPAPIFFSFVVGAPILGMYIYFIAFQTYV
jgi:transmembrane protein 216